MTLKEDLALYQSRRKFPDWKPTPATSVNRGNIFRERLVRRALDFLSLENQVFDWASEAVLIPELEDVAPFIERNAQDERKHTEALYNLSAHYAKTTPSEAVELVNRWQQSNKHPVMLSYALEMGVFFSILPALIKYGDVYAATVAQWISDDEMVHVRTNLRLMQALELKLTKDVVVLVYETVLYIFQPLGESQANLSAARAVKRLATGKDPQMLDDSLPITINFFEQATKQDIVY